jgi:hypothetical protein
MAKKKKLSLENLKVQSFVTSLSREEANAPKGDLTAGTECYTHCLTQCMPEYCPATMEGGLCSKRVCFVSDFTCDLPCPNPTMESACC